MSIVFAEALYWLGTLFLMATLYGLVTLYWIGHRMYGEH